VRPISPHHSRSCTRPRPEARPLVRAGPRPHTPYMGTFIVGALGWFLGLIVGPTMLVSGDWVGLPLTALGIFLLYLTYQESLRSRIPTRSHPDR
jgi:hypothetical protein